MAARAGLRVAAVVAVWDAGEADAGAEAEAEADAEADGWFRLGGVSCPIIRRAACAGLNVGGDPAWLRPFRSFRPLPVPAMMIICDRLIEPNSCILAPRDLC